MKKFIILISLCLLLATFASPAFSSDHKAKHHYDAHFGDMDLDGDELLNINEFKKYFSHAGEDVFKKIDADGDASIDHDEWHEFKEAQGYTHHE